MKSLVSFLFAFAVDAVISDPASVLPSKQEQKDLLVSVEEVFNAIKLLVNDEGDSTDTSVISDLQKMVSRAVDYFSVLQEATLSKLSCSTPTTRSKEKAKLKIQKLIQDGEKALQECLWETSAKISNNSQSVTCITGSAMNEGQSFLDALGGCSRKSGLQQISCYKKVITKDVFPLKLTLLDAITSHKSGHLKAISIRDEANQCVDDVLKRYKNKVRQVFTEALDSE